MNDFTVLHLSDLHIDNTDGHLSVLLKNLLEDIKVELEKAKHVVIVVTGDIVHQGNYRTRESVKRFFKELKNILEKKICKVFIVPGNHDKVRNTSDNEILENYKKNIDSFGVDGWRYIKTSFDDFNSLCHDIAAVFDAEKDVVTVFDETYGVKVEEINGLRVCFLCFNTAWNCTGDGDERHLRIGQFQLDDMKKKYAEQKDGKEVNLTIALAHHPINWLYGKEEDAFRNLLLNENGCNANVYICGHTHDRDVVNWYNNKHSLTTLVSGIGWPEKNGEHPYRHNYASYVFNLDLNSIDVYARSSDDAMHFETDFSIYTQQRNKQERKIVMPIWSGKRQGYFNLSTVNGRSSKACYITESMLSDFKKHTKSFVQIETNIQQRFEVMKLDVFNLCVSRSSKFKNFREIDNIYNFLLNNQKECLAVSRKYMKKVCKHEEFNNLFEAYLQCICSNFHRVFRENNTKTEVDIRVHFRKWNMKNDEYKQCCLDSDDYQKYEMDAIKWGELIEASFNTGRPLIASMNEDICRPSLRKNDDKADEKRKWQDFITVIPCFKRNVYKQYDSQKDIYTKERPILTFGVTIYNPKDKEMLYLLDYMDIQDVLGRLLNQFLYYFPFDIYKWVKLEGENC